MPPTTMCRAPLRIPFSFQLTAVAFKLLGVGFRAERFLVLLYAVLLIVAAERLLARYTKSAPARSLVVAVLCRSP